MARYKIWDKAEDIYTLGADENGKYQHTAQEYIQNKAPWAAIPGVKVIVGGGAINGTVFMEFGAAVEHYKNQGAEIEDGLTDEEILAVIEDFENNPPVNNVPDANERIAAALEFANLASIPDEE
jgi:hypothetical protein